MTDRSEIQGAATKTWSSYVSDSVVSEKFQCFMDDETKEIDTDFLEVCVLSETEMAAMKPQIVIGLSQALNQP